MLHIKSKKPLVGIRGERKLAPIHSSDSKNNCEQIVEQSIKSRPATNLFETHALSKINPQEEVSLTYQHYLNSIMDRMDARDQRVLVPYLGKIAGFSLRDNVRDFDQWLGEMNFAVASSSFKLFTQKQLSYEEMKVYFSQNTLLNVLLFLEQISDSEVYEVMKHLNKRLLDNIAFLVVKYPQAKEIKPNKKLRSAFNNLNNMESDNNDLLSSSGIKIQKKDSNDYAPEIMKIINYLISITSQTCTYLGQQTTYFNAFSQIMEKIFESVEYPEEFLSEDDLFELITEPEQEEEANQKLESKQEPVQDDNESSQEEAKETADQLKKLSDLPIIQEMGIKNVSTATAQGDENKETNKKVKEVEEDKPKIKSQKAIKMGNKANISTKASLQKKVSLKATKKQANKNIIEKQLKQYTEKVKKYTFFKIGQKINPNTQTYTSNEIQQSTVQIKSTAILRVLVKWISELSSKIFRAKELIKNRSFTFKTVNNSFVKLSSNQKNDLYESAQKKVHILKEYVQSMLNECLEIQGSLAKSGEVEPEMANIPKFEYMVGKFCTKLESAASTYQVNYLNKLIQSLLEIPMQIEEEEFKKDENANIKSKSVNLITFKVGDLMRCKCSSKQNEILRILKIILRISEEREDIFKVIRIKDRLELGTKDIMLNVIFMNKIICEIQLAIFDSVEEKQKMLDAFNHYLYELRRTNLGPVMESSCIWTHLDQRSKIFKQYFSYFESDVKTVNLKRHSCPGDKMMAYNFAFVCSICNIFYAAPSGLIGNKKCKDCKHFECNNCIEDKMSSQQLKQFLGLLSGDIAAFDAQFEQWIYYNKTQLPNFAIFIPKKAKTVSYIFVQKVVMGEKIYYIRTVENKEKEGRKVQARIEITLKAESPEDFKFLSDRYYVFEWMQKRYVNKTIKAQERLNEQRLERLRREEREARQKAQKQKNKQEIKKIKKNQERAWIKDLGLVNEQSESDEDDKKKNEKDEGQKNEQKGQQKEESPNFEQEDKKKKNHSKKNKENEQKNKIAAAVFNKFRPAKKGDSRPGTGSSKSSSKAVGVEKEIKVVNIQIITKVSSINDIRVAKKNQGGQDYNLVLGYYLSESEIIMQLKELNNEKRVEELLKNKNEVIFLEESKVSDFNMSVCLDTKLFSGGFSSVYEMYLDENMLTSLEFVSAFRRLRVLHANHNYITGMEGLDNLQHLMQIMLNNNKITKISGLSKKGKLVKLNLSRNMISQIENLSEAPSLESLSLYANLIECMENLDKLTKLVRLDLSMNAIADVKETCLDFLERLDLTSNQIKQIANFDKLPALKSVSFSRNRISKIENLQHLKSLVSLSLDSNQISAIENLDELKQIVELNLSKNCIQRIENISKLTKLRVLNLRKNRIAEIEYKNIESNTELEQLDLSDNCFEEIDADIVSFLEKLKQYNIIGNPLRKQLTNKSAIAKLKKKITNLIVPLL